MLGRKSDNEKKLDTAKVDLAAANARLQKVIAAEDASANSADAYAIWRSARDDAEAEVRRLDKLIAAIEAGAEDIRKHEAAELMNKRIVAARKQNEAVAERMRTDGVRLIAEVKALARDIAAACLEARAVNVALPAGVETVVEADFLACGRPGVPRENVSEKIVDLWVFENSGNLIGNQDAVTETADGKGFLVPGTGVGAMLGTSCVRRRYRHVSYRPAERPTDPVPFHASLRLPDCDGPAPGFDGSRMVIEAVAALDLDASASVKAERKARRPVQVELIPAEPWAPPALKPPGAGEAA
jgi:hypothetical protein